MPATLTTTRTLRLPKLFFDYWKPKKTAQKKITQAVLLKLVREGSISPGKAAELLQLSRWDLLELMSKENIPIADFTPQELKQQIKDFQNQ